ncbi:MAG: PQQ-binding-like beta-propeller repeat protein [Planctomycetes bacterium]|nr:PQQ-binding-like beta-propeller repeat protein [Planctomycetota bacterium]
MNIHGIRSGRIILAVVLLGSLAILTIRNTGVHEVHRATEPTNFAVMNARPDPGDWPWWRGTQQTNTAPHASVPTQWSTSGANGWRISISGRGRSALSTWGEQLFLPLSDATHDSVSIVSLDHSTGRLLWQTELHRGGLLPVLPRTANASTTPACDGKHVYIACPANGLLWVTALDLNGRIAWQREAGPYYSKWGYESSPVIYKSLVIVAADNKGAQIDRLVGASYLTALHRETGQVVWRIHRPNADSSGTPVVARIAGRDQLLLAGKGTVCSYDPLTGDSLWTCRWSADRVGNSVAFDDRNVYASTRHPRPELLCIRADGSGDVSRSHVVWRSHKFAGDVASPVVHDGRLYVAGDDGIIGCLDAETGNVVWRRQFAGTMTASPLIAGQHLYCCNEDGTVYVIRLGGHGELVAEIPMQEAIQVAPVVSQNRLYIRTIAGLNCVWDPDQGPVAIQPDLPRRRS